MKPFKVLTFNILGNWDERENAVWNDREGAVARTISEADAARLDEVSRRWRQ